MDTELVTMIGRWQTVTQQIEAFKETIVQEMQLRKAIFARVFPAPTEGTNKADLTDGWVIKATYKIDRKFDEAALPAVLEALKPLNVAVDSLVRYKPELVITFYKALPVAAKTLLDQALTSKPASPTLELVPPKK